MIALWDAVFHVRPKKIEELAAAGINLDEPDRDGNTPLIWACSNNRLSLAEFLLNYPIDVNHKNNLGLNPLIGLVSCKNNFKSGFLDESKQVKLIGKLLDAGASIDEQDDQGRTALTIASAKWRIDMVKVLLERGAKNLTTKSGHNAVMAAVYSAVQKDSKKLFDILKLLYRFDRTIKDQALLPLAGMEHIAIAKAFLKVGADVNYQDAHGYTALMYSATRNSDMVQLLLSAGANLSVKNHEGQTALDIAEKSGKVDNVKLLKDQATKSAERSCYPVDGDFM